MSVTAARRRPRRLPARLGDAPIAVLLILPALAGLAVFQWLPLGVAAWQSLEQLNPLNPAAVRFVGLANYASMLADDRFRAALVNTVLYIAGIVVLEIPIGTALALLLNRRLRGTVVARATVIAALVASETVIALVWNLMYTPGNGLFEALLGAIRIPPQPFLTSAHQALPAIVLMVVWKDVGLTMLIMLAGLQAIPPEYYEAAALDGAGAWNRFWHVTLPQLRRSLMLALFMATIAGTRVFTPVLLTTQGGPQNASVNLIYYAYEQAFQYLDYGIGSASVVVMIVLLAVITLGQARLLRSEA